MTAADEELPQSVTMNLWREALSTSVSRLATVIFGFLLVVVLAHYLSPEQVGTYFFFYAGVYLFAEVSNGLAHAVQKRVSEGGQRQCRYLWAGSLLSGGYLVAIAALTGGIALLFGSHLTQGVLADTTPTLLLALGLAVVGRSFVKLTTAYLAGLGQPGRADWMRAAVPKGLMSFLAIVVLEVFPGSLPVLFYCLTLSYLIGGGLSLLFSKPSIRCPPTRETFRSIAVFAKWSIPNNVLNDFYHRFDTFVLGLLVGAVSVGYYDASVRLSVLAFAISFGVGNATTVKVSGYSSQDRPVRPILESVLGVASIVAVPLVAVSLLFGEQYLTLLYGAEYAAAYYFLVGIAIQQVFQGFRYVFEGFFEGIDKPQYNVRASVLSVGVNVVTAIPLVLWIGGIGVVISTLFAEVVRTLVFEYIVKQETGGFVAPLLILYEGVSVSIAVLVGWAVLALKLLPPTTGTVILLTFLVLGVYLGILAGLSDRVRTVLQMCIPRPGTDSS